MSHVNPSSRNSVRRLGVVSGHLSQETPEGEPGKFVSAKANQFQAQPGPNLTSHPVRSSSSGGLGGLVPPRPPPGGGAGTLTVTDSRSPVGIRP